MDNLGKESHFLGIPFEQKGEKIKMKSEKAHPKNTTLECNMLDCKQTVKHTGKAESRVLSGC